MYDIITCLRLSAFVCRVTGKDPLLEKLEGKDINSVAGVLKLYFRELKDPLFPFHMFDDLMACSSNCNFNSQSCLLSSLCPLSLQFNGGT